MIDIIVSDNCPHCDQQKSIMRDSFDKEEYRFINVGSHDYENLDIKEVVDVVPFIIVRDEVGAVKYANRGNMEAIKIRRVMHSEHAVFNLRSRQTV